jgi:hypothetical protein
MMMTYKIKCGFMKLGCCTFKPEHCRTEKGVEGTELFCDLYEVEFTSKSVKKEMDRLKKEIKKLGKENLNRSEYKVIRKIEREDALRPEVKEYKKKLLKIKDLCKGLEYLERAYRHLKRSRK